MNNKNCRSHYERIKKKPQLFRQLTGVTVEKFNELLKQLEEEYEKWNKSRLNKRKRQRKIGGGNQFKLCLADKLLLTLMYYRLYITGDFLGFIFGLDESNIGRNRKPIEEMLAKIFKIPEDKIEMQEDELLEIFFDGTEQQINRPKKKQKQYYSGKKKKHTVKYQIVVAKKKDTKKEKLRIISVSKKFKGKTHDKKMYDKTDVKKPPGVKGKGDQGYVGTDLEIPHKKPKNGELTTEQKKYNRKLSSERICVEHAIGKMKIWRILAEKYRHKLSSHSIVMKNVAGLQNLMFS